MIGVYKIQLHGSIIIDFAAKVVAKFVTSLNFFATREGEKLLNLASNIPA